MCFTPKTYKMFLCYNIFCTKAYILHTKLTFCPKARFLFPKPIFCTKTYILYQKLIFGTKAYILGFVAIWFVIYIKFIFWSQYHSVISVSQIICDKSCLMKNSNWNCVQKAQNDFCCLWHSFSQWSWHICIIV